MLERCVLDPVEFIPERVELDLDSLGLEVRAEGVDWGESAIQAQMVRQAQGETSSDGHMPGVPIRIPIRVKEEGDVALAHAAHKLQQKVGTWQANGGWARRDFDDRGGFAGSLGYKIIRHTASLSGLQGWLFAHRQDAPDVVLTATRWPIGYRTGDLESAEFKEEAERELVYELPASSGTAEGRRRILVHNLNASADLRGLVLAEECETAPADLESPTAQLAYAAADLTPKAGAEVKTVSGIQVVEHDELTAGWIAVLDSEIDGVGHMTHAGDRLPWLRAYQVGGEPGDVETRVRYRVLGGLGWDELNPIKPTSVADAWQWYPMGVCRPQLAALGDERWQFQVMARAPGGSGAIRLHRVAPTPTEQYLRLRTVDESQGADAQSTRAAAGTVVNQSVSVGEYGAGTVAWSSPSNAKASDNARATAAITSEDYVSNILKATDFKFALPEAAVILGIVFGVECSNTAGLTQIGTVFAVKAGVVQNKYWASFPFFSSTDAVFHTGSNSQLWGLPWTASDINNAGFGIGFQAVGVGGTSTAQVDHVTVSVYYTEANDENRICFAQRSIELRSDGIYRQHADDDVWGKVVPVGSPPIAKPGGLEQRPSRGILIPSQGDFEALADSGTNKLSAVVKTRDGYHFAREAAAT